MRFETSDLPHFWHALDQSAGTEGMERADIFRRLFVERGSPGLREWVRLRLAHRRGLSDDAAGASAAERIAIATASWPRYYAAVREHASAIIRSPVLQNVVREGSRCLAATFGEAHLRPVYFVIGCLGCAGTFAPSGVLVATEFCARDASSPLDELPESLRGALTSFALGPELTGCGIVHEMVHLLQGRRTMRHTLDIALYEGTADFVAELVTGVSLAGLPYQRYGRAHEQAVWDAYSRDATSRATMSAWVGGASAHMPSNMGYWIGYCMAKAYYAAAHDKPAALRQLVVSADAEQIAAASTYDGGATSGAE